MQKVSVYIPCYNGAKYLAQCIEGILAQSYPADEILLIDDGSCDNTYEIAVQYPLTIIRHDENRGIAAARNTAIVNARNDFVAALDSDCVPDKDWLKNLMYNFDNENVAGVGGCLIELYARNLADKWRSTYMGQNWGPKKVINPPFIFGSNSVFRKDVLVKIGLYNERYRTNGEDNDLSLRLLKQGLTLVYEPTAIARHLRRDSIVSVLRMNWQWNFYGHSLHINLRNLLKGLLWDIRRIKGYIVHDVKKKRFSFLVLDLLAAFYAIYADYKSYLRSWR